MLKLDDLKPQQIKKEDYNAWVDIKDKKYIEFYKHIYLRIVKEGDKIEFWEVHDYPQTSEKVPVQKPYSRIYKLNVSTVKWLIEKKKIKSKRIRITLKLAENELTNTDRTNIRSRND